jgi:hypothetical protein
MRRPRETGVRDRVRTDEETIVAFRS